MKRICTLMVVTVVCMFFTFQAISQANTTLSNLVSPTAVNQDLLPATDQARNLGNVVKSWKRLYITQGVYYNDSFFLHGTGTRNAFAGFNSGFSITTGYDNAALGYHSLKLNQTGLRNAAFGSYALGKATVSDNSAFGAYALQSNTAGSANAAVGSFALSTNTTGKNNIAMGYASLFKNTSGSNNAGAGFKALYSNTTGYSNIAIGGYALYNSITGNQNTAIGDSALFAEVNSSSNTALGYKADVANDGITNATAIGAGAVATQSNQLMLGGPSNVSVRMQNAASYPKYLEFVTSGANVDWRFEHSSSGRYLYLSYSTDDFSSFSDRAVFDTISQANGYCLYLYGKAQSYSWDVFSDARLKKNISDFSNATAIIGKLKPKTFYFNKEKYPSLNLPSIKQYGLIAQELEEVIPELVTTSKVPVRNTNNGERQIEELKSVSYTSLIPVLIKGMQEQQSRIDAQQQQLEKQQQQNNELVARVEKLEALLHNSGSLNISSSYLEQNIPNPTKGTTTIRYNLSEQFSRAQLVVRDANGKTLKQINVTGKGAGYVQLNTSTLAAGAYNYSLVVDGKIIDTKQMISGSR